MVYYLELILKSRFRNELGFTLRCFIVGGVVFVIFTSVLFLRQGLWIPGWFGTHHTAWNDPKLLVLPPPPLKCVGIFNISF